MIAIAPPLGFFEWEFGASLRIPLAIIVGDRDQYCPAERLRALVATTHADLTVLAGADHFLAGRDDEVAAAVRSRL